MKTYTSHLALRSFNNPLWYHISVRPSQYGGAVPYKDFPTYEGFAAALLRLGVVPENIPSVVQELEKDKTKALLNLHLSEEDATFFGWPPQ